MRSTKALALLSISALASAGACWLALDRNDSGLVLINAAVIRLEGEKRVHYFTSQDLPIVRLPHELLKGVSLTWESEERSVEAKLDVVQRGKLDLLRVTELDVAEGRAELVVSLPSKMGRRQLARWPVEWMRPIDDMKELRESVRLRRERKFSEARAAITPALTATSSWVRAWAELERGHIEYTARANDEMKRWYSTGAESALALGLPGPAGRSFCVTSYLQSLEHDFAGAAKAVARCTELALQAGDEKRLASAKYMASVRAYEANEYLRSERLLVEAHEATWLIGDESQLRVVNTTYALHLAKVGRYAQALRLLETAQPPESPPGEYAAFFGTRGMVVFQAMKAGVLPPDYTKPRADFERGLEIYATRDLTPPKIAEAHVDVARTALAEGRRDLAEQHLLAIEGLSAEVLGVLRAQAALLRAELVLDRDPDRAEAMLLEVERDAKEAAGGAPTEDGCAAARLLGDVYARTGRWTAALEAYDRARRDMESLARKIQVPTSRALFMSAHAKFGEAFATALLHEGRTKDALWALDHERGVAMDDMRANVLVATRADEWREVQQLRGVHEQLQENGCFTVPDSRKVACAQEIKAAATAAGRALDAFYEKTGASDAKSDAPDVWFARLTAALGEGEALLAVFRIEDEWLAFYLAGGELTLDRRPELPSKWIARAQQASHLYVILGERTRELDPGLTPAGGRPLAASIPISWLPSTSTLLSDPHAPSEAPLFVADTDTTLPSARAVAKEHAAKFTGARLLPGDDATLAEVTAAWNGRSLVHFIGHAKTSEEDDAASARLVLAGGESLRIEDILTAQPRIGVAVLEGCTTGPRFDRQDVGLPHALLAAGTRTVIASVRDLEATDEQTKTTPFMRAFYRALAKHGPDHAAQAFRDAVAATYEGDSGWSELRLWGR